ncbi:MAG TPA: hypothetical protein PLR20_16085 [Syntrophales bacterium]|jgi:hypothetical protein|nr:hypothetical protein [Syntrophales bacterium]
MRITIEDDDLKVKAIVESPAAEFDEVVELFKQAAMAFGFHPNNVTEYFEELDEK